MLQCSIILSRAQPHFQTTEMKPDILPDWRWRVPMKNLFFAALSPGAATVPGFAHSTIADDAVATRYQQKGAL